MLSVQSREFQKKLLQEKWEVSPIPNWCSDSVQIEGRTLDVIHAVQAISIPVAVGDQEERHLSFSAYLPRPEGLDGGAACSWSDTHWGTKWDVDRSEAVFELKTEKGITVASTAFQTAWGPPAEFFRNVAENFDGIDVELSFDEPGSDFAGTLRWDRGYLTRNEETNSELGANAHYGEDEVYHSTWDECEDHNNDQAVDCKKVHYTARYDDGNYYLACDWGHCVRGAGHLGVCSLTDATGSA